MTGLESGAQACLCPKENKELGWGCKVRDNMFNTANDMIFCSKVRDGNE